MRTPGNYAKEEITTVPYSILIHCMLYVLHLLFAVHSKGVWPASSISDMVWFFGCSFPNLLPIALIASQWGQRLCNKHFLFFLVPLVPLWTFDFHALHKHAHSTILEKCMPHDRQQFVILSQKWGCHISAMSHLGTVNIVEPLEAQKIEVKGIMKY
jgi:hypothetical protein